MSEYAKQYYQANRERILAKSRARNAPKAEMRRRHVIEHQSLPGEEWRSIPGSTGYLASSHGRIIGQRGWVLKDQTHVLGYRLITVEIDGRHIMRTVHSIIALTFIGPRPDGLDVCHNDGDKTNNRADNLRYDTREGNLADNYNNGTYFGRVRVRYPLNTRAPDPRFLQKLTVEDVHEIRRQWQTGQTYVSHLARQYGVSFDTIRHHLFGTKTECGHYVQGIANGSIIVGNTVVSNATVH
jgi:hypothetical protein